MVIYSFLFYYYFYFYFYRRWVFLGFTFYPLGYF